MSWRKGPSYQKECVQYKCTNSRSCDRTWTSSHSWRQCRKYCSECKTEGVAIGILDRKLNLDNFKCQSCGRFWQSKHIHKNDDNQESVQQQQCKCGESVSANGGEKRYCRHYGWKCPKVECGQHWNNLSFDREFIQRCVKCGSPGVIIGLSSDVHSGPHKVKHCEMCQDLIRNGNPDGCVKAKKVGCFVNRTQGVGGSSNTMSKLQVIERSQWLKYNQGKM
ncbi:unnamed protein product [Orchesella dallaii]|uniref:Uncharacterized protein n=1 Tax=Orchesella dallaii TaxID=48710 RepID=A0ABP1Q720_9HEXA